MRSNEEIEKQIRLAIENDGKFFGMTYEQGVRNALEWITGEQDETPMEE